MVEVSLDLEAVQGVVLETGKAPRPASSHLVVTTYKSFALTQSHQCCQRIQPRGSRLIEPYWQEMPDEVDQLLEALLDGLIWLRGYNCGLAGEHNGDWAGQRWRTCEFGADGMRYKTGPVQNVKIMDDSQWSGTVWYDIPSLDSWYDEEKGS